MTVTPLQRFATWQLSTIARSCLVMVAAVVSMGVVLLVAIILAYLVPLPRSWDDLRFVVGLIVGVSIYVILWCSAGLLVVLARRRRLNAVISQFHVQFQSSMIGQRNQASVMIDGIEINVLIQKGPMLTLSVPIQSGVRAVINDLSKLQSSDQHWIQQWLEQTQVKDQIKQLLTVGSESEVRSILITPQTMMFRIYRFPLSSLTADTTQALVHNFVAIARAARQLPPSSTPVEVSPLDQLNDVAIYQPQKMILWFAIGFGALLLGSSLMVGLLVLVVAVLN